MTTKTTAELIAEHYTNPACSSRWYTASGTFLHDACHAAGGIFDIAKGQWVFRDRSAIQITPHDWAVALGGRQE